MSMLISCLVMLSGVIINEDDSHFFMTREPDQMTVEGLQAFVDQYADSKVSHLFLCPNAQKASYRSGVWDAIWDMAPNQRVPEDDAAPIARRWMSNAKLLHERGLDPYAVWIARCREKKISPWLSMRMNDIHNVEDPDNYIHSKFWIDHPEYWRVPGSKGFMDRAFDYAIPEVRDHHMKLVRELLERYDPDGLELDWMRFGYHFKPGHEAEGRQVLTQFMREVRALTREWSEKRGHPILLGARVPTTPESAVGLGMDAPTWAREGLIDMLVPTPFWATTDFDIPVERWRQVLGDKQPILAAGIEILVRPSPGAKAVCNDIASTRGFAASSLHRGADLVYTFNFMDPAPMSDGAKGYRALVEQGLDLKTVTSQPRRHPVTYRDTVAAGVSSEVQLPANAAEGATFKIHIGPAPKSGSVAFVVGLAEKSEAPLEVALNGAACTRSSDLEKPDQFAGAAHAIEFECPSQALVDGYNTMAVKGEAQIVWTELRITPHE